jgi:hypothetical protein
MSLDDVAPKSETDSSTEDDTDSATEDDKEDEKEVRKRGLYVNSQTAALNWQKIGYCNFQ